MGKSDLEIRVDELEKKMGWVVQILFNDGSVAPGKTAEALGVLRTLTKRQHVAAQMLVAGESNATIAEAFGVTENTAKVYVRGLAKKLGKRQRGQIAMRYRELMESVSEEEYLGVSGVGKEGSYVKGRGPGREIIRRRNG